MYLKLRFLLKVYKIETFYYLKFILLFCLCITILGVLGIKFLRIRINSIITYTFANGKGFGGIIPPKKYLKKVHKTINILLVAD